jgi:hypothetical protein
MCLVRELHPIAGLVRALCSGTVFNARTFESTQESIEHTIAASAHSNT